MIRTLLALLPDQYRSGVNRFAASAVLSVLLRAVGVVMLVPLISGLVDGNHAAALAWMGGLTAVTVAGWVVDYAASKQGYVLGFGLLDTAQRSVAERLTRIRLTWFTADNTATARQAIAATGPDLVGVVVYLMVPMITAFLLPAAIGLTLFGVAWQLAVVALLGVPLLAAALWSSSAMSRGADEVAAEANSEFTERIVEFARTQPALRVARRAEPARSAVGEALARQHGATGRLLLMQIPGRIVFGIAGQIALFAFVGVAAWLTVRGDLSVAEAVALIVVAVRFLEPFTAISELSGGLETARTTLARIRTVLDSPTEHEGAGSAPAELRPPRIEFEAVTYDYGDPTNPVLDGLDLVLEPGSTTAIIGPSGSGKSTVLGLIAGLYSPTGGRILFDGIDAATLDHEARSRLASMVFQQPYLMEGSIAENVLAGYPDASAERVQEVSRLARVDEITARLPRGAETEVGEGGGALSGGERQRVSIARALLKPAPVLLIDEATSALDNENERAVVDALSSDSAPRTRVIVAHRQAGIRHVDRVVVLEFGRVIESGTPDELIAAGGRFATFWEHQGAIAGWKLTDAVD
ncbi:ABC transporter ATP-binding protein [Rhodococcus gannanensis]|uniref:ABC transporter ATP-binding protein n=1 Tax=Rhodococcus gannanensis TaxID=1960308 RepID=A0ABW4PB11_9NOCA